MRTRRVSDATPRIATWTGSAAQSLVRPRTTRGSPADELFLLVDSGGPEVLLVAGDQARAVSRTGSTDTLQEHVRRRAQEWATERFRARHGAMASETLLLYAEELSRATSTNDLVEAALRLPAFLIGGPVALVLLHRSSGADPTWRLLRADTKPAEVPAPPMRAHGFTHTPVLYRRSDLTGAARHDACLPPLFQHTGAETLALAGMGESAVVLVADRRHVTEPDPEDWYVLRRLARLGGAALARIGG